MIPPQATERNDSANSEGAPMDNPETRPELLGLTSKIVTAHLSANSVAPADLPEMIKSVYDALANTIAPAEPPAAPAVPIKRSVTRNHIACLEDGKKFKMLKRHLRNVHNLSPQEYRAKWGLASDYPMTAPAYAEQRSALAKAAGLGKPRPKGRKKPKRKSAGRA